MRLAAILILAIVIINGMHSSRAVDTCPKLTSEGVKFIKEAEGFRSKPYLCEANKLTIGYGFTRIYGRPVSWNDRMSIDEAEKILYDELNNHCSSMKKYKLTDNQYTALCSLAYTIGPSAFLTSSIYKKLEAGMYSEIDKEFRKWDKVYTKSGFRRSFGLAMRREKERRLYNKVEKEYLWT